jgi:hypothetical protein
MVLSLEGNSREQLVAQNPEYGTIDSKNARWRKDIILVVTVFWIEGT